MAVPVSADVHAVIAGIHDMGFIVVFQPAVGIAKGLESFVGEPVVQRTHPAGLLASGKFRQSLFALMNAGKIGNRVVCYLLLAGTHSTVPIKSLVLECLEHHGHHGVFLA